MQALTNVRLGALERSIRALDWLARRRGRVSEQPAHLATGERGEWLTYLHLRQNGFTVVARRWNDGPLPGDLDLIAWQGETLCFIEVKTRTSRQVATASASVDRNKRQILRRLARQYLRQLPGSESPAVRFDIVTVYELPGQQPEIQIIPGAFSWTESE